MSNRHSEKHSAGGEPTRHGIGRKVIGWLLGGGALGLVLILLQLMQAPQTVASFHEWTCKSSWFGGLAGLFGDCAAYAQKPSGPVAAAPTTPVPRAVLYAQQLENFRSAVNDADDVYLATLRKDGFKLKSESFCAEVARQVRESRVRGKALKERAERMRQFVEGDIRCGDDGISIDAMILDQVVESQIRSRGVYCHPIEWVEIQDVVDPLKPFAGSSKDLSVVANRYLKLFRSAVQSEAETWVRYCVAVLDRGSADSAFTQQAEMMSRVAGGCLYNGGLSQLQLAITSERKVGEPMERHCRFRLGNLNPKSAFKLGEFETVLARWAK